jgi:hypothetical protein
MIAPWGVPVLLTNTLTKYQNWCLEPESNPCTRPACIYHDRPLGRTGSPHQHTHKIPKLVPRTGIEPVRPLFRKAADFKSAVSTNFTTEALTKKTTLHLANTAALASPPCDSPPDCLDYQFHHRGITKTNFTTSHCQTKKPRKTGCGA